MDIIQLLNYAVTHKASDLHISTGMSPIVRIDGDLMPIENLPVLEEEDVKTILKAILPERRLQELSEKFSIDLSLSLEGVPGRFRVNIFYQLRGLSVVFRVIPEKILTLEELGLPKVLKKFCEYSQGLVLVTGPTGTGKSTTLAAMIDYINKTRPQHIITIEDPIEFVYQSQRCLIQQREVGEHTRSFTDALRVVLREDPDVILVGEMRDLETIRLALTAAETGHLVFATLHTSSAAKTINRVIDVFPAGDKPLIRSMLSESLQAVISEVLVKKISGGRVAAMEIMTCSPAVRNLIREDKIPQIYSSIQTGKSLDMKTLQQDLEDLVAKKLIDKSILEEYKQQ
jgi:twitching motility protein PilT